MPSFLRRYEICYHFYGQSFAIKWKKNTYSNGRNNGILEWWNVGKGKSYLLEKWKTTEVRDRRVEVSKDQERGNGTGKIDTGFSILIDHPSRQNFEMLEKEEEARLQNDWNDGRGRKA